MRFGTLLVGGVLGAAAAVYFTRGGLMRSIAGLTPDNEAIGKFTEKASGSLFEDSGQRQDKKERLEGKQTESLDKLRDLIKDDPKVMAQVNEILSASGESPKARVHH